VDSCADHIVTCLSYLSSHSSLTGEPRGYVKILASEQETSIAQIIATFARIAHRHPKLICSPSPAAALHPRHLKYRSLLWRHLGTPPWCNLEAGIKRLHQHHLALYLRGGLSPPS
jgi:hypothetical protein